MILFKDTNDYIDVPLSTATGQQFASAGVLGRAVLVAWVKPLATLTANQRYMELMDEAHNSILYLWWNNSLTANYAQITGASSSGNSYGGANQQLQVGKWNLIALSVQTTDAGLAQAGFRWNTQSESGVAQSYQGFAGSIGAVTTPTRVRLYGFPGGVVWGPVVIRHHAQDYYSAVDHATIFNTNQAYGAMIVDDGSRLTGSADCVFAVNHAMMPRPFDAGSGPLLMPGFTADQGAPIYDAGATQFGTPELVGRGFAEVGGTPQFISHEDEPWRSLSDLFQRSTTWTGYNDFTPVPVGGGGTNTKRFIHRQPSGLMRVALRGNSRTVMPTDGGYGYPGSYTGAWYREMESITAGVDFTPMTSNDSVNQNLEGCVTFGFSRGWGIVPDADSGAFITNPPFSVGHYVTNRNDGWSIMASGKNFRLLAKPQGLCTIDAPLHQVIHYLKFPGGGRFQVAPARDTGQVKTVNEWQGDFDIVRDTNTPTVNSHTVTAGEAASYDSVAKTIVLTGINQGIVSGYVGAKGQDLAHVASAVESGGNTTITFDHPYSVAPVEGDVIKFGTWAYAKYEFDHDPVSDIAEWRGFRIYTDDTAPVIFLGVGSWNPDANGFVWLAAGLAGEGFTPQLAGWNTSAVTPDDSPRLLFHTIQDADLNLFVDQGQSSEPSSMTDMRNDLLIATPDAEFIYLSDWVWGYTGSDAAGAASWANGVYALAQADGVPFASAYHVGGNAYDKALDGDWHDSGNHSSNRGGRLVVREWLSQLQTVIEEPTQSDGLTSIEWAQLRYRLGIDGDSAIPTATPDLARQVTALAAATSAASADSKLPFSGIGPFARTVTVTVDDVIVTGAQVTMSDGALVYSAITNSEGVATFGLAAATYTLAVFKAGYSYTPTDVVVAGAGDTAAALTQIAVSPGSPPATTTAILTTYDSNMTPLEGVTIEFIMDTPPSGSGSAFDKTPKTATSDADGLLSVSLACGAVYIARREGGDWIKFLASSEATSVLPNVLGAPALI